MPTYFFYSFCLFCFSIGIRIHQRGLVEGVLRGTLLNLEQNQPPCYQKHVRNNNNILDIYWINLDNSTERRWDMTKFLDDFGVNHTRISAITPDEIVIPGGLGRPKNCNTLNDKDMNRKLRRLSAKTAQAFTAREDARGPSNQMLQQNFTPAVRKFFLASHCGRVKNNQKHLAVTLSHLLAIRTAIYNPVSQDSNYALIMEDDLKFGFEINFEELIKSAPKDFAVLQLVTSDEGTIYQLHEQYQNSGEIWVSKQSYPRSWCAGAYIINKAKFKPIIDALLFPRTQHVHVAHILAVTAMHKNTTFNSITCWNHTRESPELPCVFAPHGYEADLFLYNFFVNQTYLLSLPITISSSYAVASTIHQDHVKSDTKAFNTSSQIIYHMLFPGTFPVPRPDELLNVTVVNRSLVRGFPSFTNLECVKHCRVITGFCSVTHKFKSNNDRKEELTVLAPPANEKGIVYTVKNFQTKVARKVKKVNNKKFVTIVGPNNVLHATS